MPLGTVPYSPEGLSSQVVEFHAIWSGIEDWIAKSKQFLSNKFTSGLAGAKSVWQNVLTCQLELQFHSIVLCITMVRIHSPFDFSFSEVWMLKTEQWWDQISVLVNYLKLQGIVFLNGRICCFILAMGIVLISRQIRSDWIRYHLPHPAASGDHCCKHLKIVSSSETQLGRKEGFCHFFLFRSGTAQCIGTCKDCDLTWAFLRSSVLSKLTAFFICWLGLVYHCTVPMYNILFVVMEALLQVQCQERHLLCTLHPASGVAGKTCRVALQRTIALQGVGGWTGRDRNRIAGDFHLDKALQSFMFSEILHSYVSSLELNPLRMATQELTPENVTLWHQGLWHLIS